MPTFCKKDQPNRKKMCLYFGGLQVFVISNRFPETEVPIIVTNEPIKSADIFILSVSLVIPFFF